MVRTAKSPQYPESLGFHPRSNNHYVFQESCTNGRGAITDKHIFLIKSMMKIVIIEDEALAAKDLQKLLRECEKEAEIIAVLSGVEEATAWFQAHSEPDLLFCDIQLSDGVSFDFFKRVSVRCPVIFTTAYNEYALRAFKLNSIDYLLKPVDKDELAAALAKFHRLREHIPEVQPSNDLREQFAAMLRELSPPNTAPIREEELKPTDRFKSRFLVHGKGGMLIVPVEEIALFQKDEVIYLITRDGKRHLSDAQTMEELDETLNPTTFFRANRQTILHISAVEGFKTDFTGKAHVHIKNLPQLSVDISREKAGAFKKWLG